MGLASRDAEPTAIQPRSTLSPSAPSLSFALKNSANDVEMYGAYVRIFIIL